MNSYLLLRSNKQSGPFSLQQLLSLGLKPYDLLWVEGKSAAWSYPSEVAELKPYAPAIEEQPFDRFYKKPEAEFRQTKWNEIRNEDTVQNPVATTPQPIREKPLKKVYVSLPATYNPERKNSPAQAPVVLQSNQLKDEPCIEKPAPELKEEYSESLDSIKKKYEEIYLKRKKNNRWRKNLNALLQVTGGAVFICLIAVLVYNNFALEEKPMKPVNIVSKKLPQNNPVAAAETRQSNPVSTEKKKNNLPAEEKKELKNDLPPVVKQKPVINQKQPIVSKNNSDKNSVRGINSVPGNAVTKTEKEEAGVLQPVMEKPVKKEPEKFNIRKYVRVNANEFKRRPFGGIMNLQLTVKNDSRFALETVVVELQYLKPSEQPLKTEKIVFNTIAPLGSQTIKVPDFLRGVNVSYRITSIETSSLDKYNAGQ
jgi:hypothetical protein